MSPKTIKRKRRAAGLSQEMLARRVDVTLRTIVNWESGKTVPTLANAKALSEFFAGLEAE